MALVTSVSIFRGIVTLSADGRTLARIRQKDFSAFPLAEGDVFSEEEYIDRLAAKQLVDACNTAVALLASGERTQAELRRALMRKGFVAPAVDAAVQQAVEKRYVDDARVARRMAELAEKSSAGAYAIARKLRAKGVSQEDVEEALTVLDEEQQHSACGHALEKIAHRYENLPRREARAKASQALARRGFSWEHIASVIDSWLEDSAWDED